MANSSKLCNEDKGMVGGILKYNWHHNAQILAKTQANQSMTQKVEQRGIWEHPPRKKESREENGMHST